MKDQIYSMINNLFDGEDSSSHRASSGIKFPLTLGQVNEESINNSIFSSQQTLVTNNDNLNQASTNADST